MCSSCMYSWALAVFVHVSITVMVVIDCVINVPTLDQELPLHLLLHTQKLSKIAAGEELHSWPRR